jgi:hypothetical protein
MDALQLVKEWLQESLVDYDVAIEIHNERVYVIENNTLTGLAIKIRDERNAVRLTFPDRWAIDGVVDQKIEDFHLYEKDSLHNLTNRIKEAFRSATRCKHTVELTGEDIGVIIDQFAERLPMVWQDAIEEVNKGRELELVISEMNDGHILRLLRKLGYKTEDWVSEFRNFMVGGDNGS